MRRLIGLAVAALWCAVVASAAFASPEQAEEAWRSPFGTFRGISVNRLDGSCWVSSGSHVLHVGADGQVLAQVGGLSTPMGVAVNERDGSCWVADEGRSQVLHVSADGTVLTTVPEIRAGLVAVNSANGSCAVTIADLGSDFAQDFTYHYLGLVCLSEDGTELWRSEVGKVAALAASPADGSWWLTGNSQVAQIRADGTEAWRHDISGDWVWLLPTSLSVNPEDGTAWMTDGWNLIHLSTTGAEVGRVTGAWSVTCMSLSVDPRDGSLWAASMDREVFHLSATGTELLRTGDFSPGEMAVAVASPADGSCFVLAGGAFYDAMQPSILVAGALVHLAADGTQLWRAESTTPAGVAVNPLDGSCWVARNWLFRGIEADLVHVAADGTPLQRVSGRAEAVAVNAADGSVWALMDDDLVHFTADGSQLSSPVPIAYATGVAVNPTDGSCWAIAGYYVSGVGLERPEDSSPGLAVHVAENGTVLTQAGGFSAPRSVSVDPRDGSCWVTDRMGYAIHLAEDGTELSATGDDYKWVSVDPADGSCWAAGDAFVARLAPDGSESWRKDGYNGGPLSVNAADGTCWMTSALVTPPRVVHLAPDGTQLWASTDLAPDLWGFAGWGTAISVNPLDGSCWVADAANGQVAHFTVAGYPAQDFGDVLPRHWAFAEVEACAAAGLVEGFPGGNYRPDLEVTRGQMAVYLARALALPTGDAAVPTGPAEPTFPDVDTEHWAYQYVESCSAQGIVQGYPNGTYQPDVPVNRGQMAVYIARSQVTPSGDAALPDPPAAPTFSDVTAENDWSWCYPHVEYCAAEGIVQGYADGYRPGRIVTRDQMAVYIARAFDLPL